MSGTSCVSSSAGFRRRRGALAALVALALAACGPKPAPTAQSIALAPGDFPRIVSIDTLRYADESAAPTGSGLLNAGRWAYNLGAPDGGQFKVRVLLFAHESAAKTHWQGMHRPEALAATTPLDAGDEGWIYRDEMAATRSGRAIVEIKARGGKGRLADFTRACAAKAARELRP